MLPLPPIQEQVPCQARTQQEHGVQNSLGDEYRDESSQHTAFLPPVIASGEPLAASFPLTCSVNATCCIHFGWIGSGPRASVPRLRLLYVMRYVKESRRIRLRWATPRDVMASPRLPREAGRCGSPEGGCVQPRAKPWEGASAGGVRREPRGDRRVRGLELPAYAKVSGRTC